MTITKEQHAFNVKSIMLNHADKVYNAIKAGRPVESDKACQLWLEKLTNYINKHNIE